VGVNYQHRKYHFRVSWLRVVWKGLLIVAFHRETISFLKVFSQPVLQVFTIPENITFYSLKSVYQIDKDVFPPGSLLENAVSLPKICVFRI